MNGHRASQDASVEPVERVGVGSTSGIKIKDTDQPGRYGPPELSGSQRVPLMGDPDPKSLCTSHVERNNLTLLTFLRRLTRLSLGFSKKLCNLKASVALNMVY